MKILKYFLEKNDIFTCHNICATKESKTVKQNQRQIVNSVQRSQDTEEEKNGNSAHNAAKIRKKFFLTVSNVANILAKELR